MPTESDRLVSVLRALLSTGRVELAELDSLDFPPRGGYRLTVDSSIMIDGPHWRAIVDVMAPPDVSDITSRITKYKEASPIP